jgi:hypothetical protein
MATSKRTTKATHKPLTLDSLLLEEFAVNSLHLSHYRASLLVKLFRELRTSQLHFPCPPSRS